MKHELPKNHVGFLRQMSNLATDFGRARPVKPRGAIEKGKMQRRSRIQYSFSLPLLASIFGVRL